MKEVFEQNSEKVLSDKEKETKKSEVFNVISKEKIDECKKKLLEEHKIDLSDIVIKRARPGDNLFNRHEIIHKLFMKCNSDWSSVDDLIREYNYNPGNIKIDQLKDIANRESIVLEGKLPGLAMTV